MTHAHRWLIWLGASVIWFAGWTLVFALQDPRASALHWFTEPVVWLWLSGLPLNLVFAFLIFIAYALLGPMHVEGFGALAVGKFNLGVLVPIFVSWLQWFVILPLLVWHTDR